MLKAYKYALLPSEEQKRKLAQFFGSCRFVYNLALETKRYAWSSQRKHVSCFELLGVLAP
jgi:putative transposase